MISLYIVCLVLVIVGALNWGLVGAANFNLVSSLTSLVSSSPTTVNMVNRTVYVVVGAAALYVLWENWERISRLQ
jgi:uncharacterized membrane protein YuzA (DUF378 family)